MPRSVGVAIPVPEPYGSSLRHARRSFGDVLADIVPTHITLLPPTVVPTADLSLVHEHLSRVAAGVRPFRVVLDGAGTFRPVSPVVFVRVVEGGLECGDVAAAVRAGVLDRALDFEYHPHVTVAHHLDDEALDRAQRAMTATHYEFMADEFVLYSREGEDEWTDETPFAFGVPPGQTPG